MERYAGKHQKEPGHQARDTPSPVDYVRSPGHETDRRHPTGGAISRQPFRFIFYNTCRERATAFSAISQPCLERRVVDQLG